MVSGPKMLGELVVQPGRGGSQCQSLVDGQIEVVVGGQVDGNCRSCRTPLIGVMGFGVVRDDDIVRGGGGIRVEGRDQSQSEECSADLGGRTAP